MIKLSGQGEVGEKGAPRGDLYILVSVKPHDLFTREGNDIYFEMPITFVQAALGDEIEVPLIEIAHARSGDKGNHSNISVIARKADYLPWIRAALTEQTVASYMQHVLDAEKGRVIRYELPGLNALNFMLENALGGGGVASLRIDPQGKAFAQQLLDMPVKVPAHLLEK